jgi:septum site-determining protein MinD
VTLNNVASAPARAYIDAAKRLSGETIEMMIPADRKPILQRLFGRRAA